MELLKHISDASSLSPLFRRSVLQLQSSALHGSVATVAAYFPLTISGRKNTRRRRRGSSSLCLKRCLCSSSSALNPVSASDEHVKLIKDVRERLKAYHGHLPTGKYGRDDEEMICWFLKDRRFDIDETVFKLVKSISWHKEFGVVGLTEQSVERMAATGKAYFHEFPDVAGRPVVVVVAAKHFPKEHDLLESEKLCVYLLEKALSQLLPGQDKILGIFDLRGFTLQNSDLSFIKFLIDVFYYYYPRRLGEVLFVDAPLLFQPGWNIIKPWLKSYASLVKFCGADVVREKYFTPETLPSSFKL